MEVLASAESLDPADTNGLSDIYLRDRHSGAATLLTRSPYDRPANGPSEDPAITADGRFVVFTSEASNLVERDRNGFSDVFVVEVATRRVRRASQGRNAVQGDGPSRRGFISANGRFVAFETTASNLAERDGNGRWDVYLHDAKLDRVTRVSFGLGLKESNGDSRVCGLSADGRTVLFESAASNIVRGDKNESTDVFLASRRENLVRRVSITSEGLELAYGARGRGLSEDGRTVAFCEAPASTFQASLWDVGRMRVRDLRIGVTEAGSLSPSNQETLLAAATSGLK